MNNSSSIISKVWSFCNVLKDDGVSYGDYLEQLTYLLFLKMADEFGRPPYSRSIGLPPEYNWESLRTRRGAELESHYVTLLRTLGTQKGILGQIFTKSQNKIQDPAKLYRIIQMIDAENWVVMGADVKGDIYEGLLEKNAEDTKSGAGQYFTPRALIQAMVTCIRPEPGKTIADPACGTGGFFLAAYDFILHNYELNRELKKKTMQFEDLGDFIKCYNPEHRHARKESWSEENPEGRWRRFTYEEIISRDKTSLDIFWLKDKSLTDLDNLPDPDDLANEIIENLEAGLDSFKSVIASLNGNE